MRVETSPKSTHIPALTGMRAIAAAMVFFYHWLFNIPDQWAIIPRAIVREGYLGVTIFFALSGFLITVRYYDDLRERSISYGMYLFKRFARIYPLYFVVLTFMVVALGRPNGRPPVDTWSAMVQYTLTQALFPSMLLTGTATAWTLTIEEMFYLLAPLLMKWFSPDLPRQRSFVAHLLARFALISIITIGLTIALSNLPQFLPNTLFGAQETYLLQYSPFGRLPDLLIGMVFGLVYLNRDRWPRLLRYSMPFIWVGLVGMGLGILLCYVAGGEIGSYPQRALSFTVAAFCGLTVFGMALDAPIRNPITRLLGTRLMTYLGKLSYSLYLIQLTEPCQWAYWILLGKVEERTVRALLLYGVTTVMCIVLYELVESPAQRRITRFGRLLYSFR
ncbi:MAG: acyltransferase [Chloroflexi bacterium]|nr:acyltransferase [Chloroflexota bacterium]MCL5274652.1 acyltransferase [Chloroflexota bacterium]